MDLIQSANDIIDEIKPDQIYRRRLRLDGTQLNIDQSKIELDSYPSIHVVGVGKAAAYSVEMLYQFLTPVLGSKLKRGLACTKYDHGVKSSSFECFESAHPTPDQNSILAADRLIEYVSALPEEGLLIVCLSGGASSLAVKPVAGFDLAFKQQISKELLLSGAPIEEMNQIRRELSELKNGGLARYSGTRDILVLAISDIPSGQMSMIGSGPCFYEQGSDRAMGEIGRSYLSDVTNQRFEQYLGSQARLDFRRQKEKLLSGKKIDHHLICDFKILMSVSKKVLEKSTQKEVVVVDTPLIGDIEAGVQDHLDWIRKLVECGGTLVSGGEYTVNVTGNGVGGRNHEFVLLLSKQIFWDNKLELAADQLQRISFLSVGTDGTDGMTTAAGSFMNYELYCLAKKMNLDIIKYLENNDSYNFFSKINSVINTGATQTNVMDLRIVQVGEC